MNKLIHKLMIAALLLSSSIYMASCDYIDEPFIDKSGNIDTLVKVRKVLLEDFTGHCCVNCPQAHEIVKQLESLYGEKLITIGVHAGVFAFPLAAPWDYDFRTTVGNTLETSFGISSYPSGLVNRKKVSGSIIQDKDNWGTVLAGIINEPADAFITLTNTYNSASRTLEVKVETEILTTLSGVYRLCVFLTEDNIVKPQKNNDASLGSVPDIMNYNHTHVLRGAINSTWGDTLAVDPATGQQITRTFTGFTLDAGWKESDCKVIAFIYRDDDADGTRYEVVQAEKKKVQ
jgi:hypothetical protein